MKIGRCFGKFFNSDLKQKVNNFFSKIRDIAVRILVGIGQVFAAVAAVATHFMFAGTVLAGALFIAYNILASFKDK